MAPGWHFFESRWAVSVNLAETTEGQRLLEALRDKGLVQGDLSRWGQPALRDLPPDHEPQRLKDASPLQRRLVACAHGTPSPGDDLCASWIEQALSRLGIGVVLGDARLIYDSYCHHTDLSELKVGMVVAVPAHPFSAQGQAHGHVGLYVGDDLVMDSVDSRIRKVPLDLWLSTYGLMAEPRWGWLGSIGLA